jgi:hypothetical protein
VTFCVLRPWRWQHMLLTVSLYKRNPRTFEPLGWLFRWLAQCDRADDTPGEREA